MARSRVAWLLSLALMAAGAILAHALAYRLVTPHHHMGESMHAETAHGYVLHLDACLAVSGTVALLGLAAAALTQLRRGHVVRAPLWLFALVPPLGFAIQEHLEHLFATGSLPQAAALDPTFAVGLVLQLPFALTAFLVARALLALAVALVETLCAEPRSRLVPLDVEHRPPIETARPLASALARGYGQRAPPLAVV